MKKLIKRKLMLPSLVTALIAVMMMALPVSADPGTSLSISPSTKTVNPGDPFDITIMIDTYVAIRGAQCYIAYDPTLVEYVSAEEGTFYSDWAAGHGASTFYSNWNNQEPGTVGDLSIAILGGTGGPTGSGSFAVVHMKAKDGISGISPITLHSVIIIDDAGGEIPGVVINNAEVVVGEVVRERVLVPLAQPPDTAKSKEQAPPPQPFLPSPPPPPPPSQEEPTTVKLDGLMTTTDLAVDRNGRVQANHQLWSLSEKVCLDIAQGTKLVDAQGNTLESLSANEAVGPQSPSSQLAIVCCYDFGPDGATFEPAITLTIRYDPSSLPREMAEDELYIAYWDGKRWAALESTVDTEAKIIWTEINHFTQFIVVSELLSPSTPTSALAQLPSPAIFTLSDLSITPLEVKPAEPVTISSLVMNTGGSEGSYAVVLKINGAEETRKEVAIAAGQSETVIFNIAKDTEGTYTVNINGKVGQFTIIAPAPPVPPTPTEASTVMPTTGWWLFGSITAGCVVVIGLLLYSSLRRRLGA